jgi:Pilus formation protein N terminal region
MSTVRSAAVLTALALAGAGATFAQKADAPKPALAVRVEAIIVPEGETQIFQMKNNQVIRSAFSTNDKVASVNPNGNDPASLLVRGLKPGLSKMTLKDAQGNPETTVIVVEAKPDKK